MRPSGRERFEGSPGPASAISSMSTTRRNPAGSFAGGKSTGGQFATSTRDEADLSAFDDDGDSVLVGGRTSGKAVAVGTLRAQASPTERLKEIAARSANLQARVEALNGMRGLLGVDARLPLGVVRCSQCGRFASEANPAHACALPALAAKYGDVRGRELAWAGFDTVADVEAWNQAVSVDPELRRQYLPFERDVLPLGFAPGQITEEELRRAREYAAKRRLEGTPALTTSQAEQIARGMWMDAHREIIRDDSLDASDRVAAQAALSDGQFKHHKHEWSRLLESTGPEALLLPHMPLPVKVEAMNVWGSNLPDEVRNMPSEMRAELMEQVIDGVSAGRPRPAGIPAMPAWASTGRALNSDDEFHKRKSDLASKDPERIAAAAFWKDGLWTVEPAVNNPHAPAGLADMVATFSPHATNREYAIRIGACSDVVVADRAANDPDPNVRETALRRPGTPAAVAFDAAMAPTPDTYDKNPLAEAGASNPNLTGEQVATIVTSAPSWSAQRQAMKHPACPREVLTAELARDIESHHGHPSSTGEWITAELAHRHERDAFVAAGGTVGGFTRKKLGPVGVEEVESWSPDERSRALADIEAGRFGWERAARTRSAGLTARRAGRRVR